MEKNKKQSLKELVIDDTAYKTQLSRKYENRIKWKNPDKREIYSVIPGTVYEIFVKPGDKVEKGAPLMTLDAMKMHNIIKAPHEGTVKEIFVEKGQKISKHAKMFMIE